MQRLHIKNSFEFMLLDVFRLRLGASVGVVILTPAHFYTPKCTMHAHLANAHLANFHTLSLCNRNLDQIQVFLRWFLGTKALLITIINHICFQNKFLTLRGAADFFKCIFAKNGAFLIFLIFLKLSFFCDKHLISFEDNTFSQIFIFHTAHNVQSKDNRISEHSLVYL